MEQTNTERTLGIGDFWSVFKRAFLLMLISAVLFTAIHAFYQYTTYCPVYVSDGTINTMRIGATTTDGTGPTHPGNEVEYAIFVQPQCVELMKTRPVRLAVLQELGLTEVYTPEALASIVSIEPIMDTSLIRVIARAGTAELAKKIVDSYMRNSIHALMESSLVGTADGMGWVEDEASPPSAPSNSRFSLLSVVIGFAVAVLVYLVFLILYVIKDRAEDPNEIASLTGLPLIGVIPAQSRRSTPPSHSQQKDGKEE